MKGNPTNKKIKPEKLSRINKKGMAAVSKIRIIVVIIMDVVQKEDKPVTEVYTACLAASRH